MNIKYRLLLIISLLVFSCKDEKQKEENTNPSSDLTQVTDNIFRVSIEAKILEDDKLELFYLGESANTNFNSKERIAKYIKGSNEFQKIEFALPKGIIPYKFRIDLGDNVNKHETEIAITSITLSLNDNEIFVDTPLLNSFFHPNTYLQTTDQGYQRKIVEDRYDPFILSKPVLDQKIELEL